MSKSKTAVIVLGMHRSGTSTISGIFSMLGCDLGKSVMGGNPTNPKGFYENYRFMFFNDSLLRACHADWHHTFCIRDRWWENPALVSYQWKLKRIVTEEFGDSELLLFKDPRLCILLPFYQKFFRDSGIQTKYCISLRNPLDVTTSLMRRDHFTRAKSERIWLDHMLKAESYTRDQHRTIVQYEQLLDDPSAAAPLLLSALDLPLQVTGEIVKEIQNFVEPALNHGSSDSMECKAVMTRDSELYYHFLLKLCQGGSGLNFSDADGIFEGFYKGATDGEYPKVSVLTVLNGDAPGLEAAIVSAAGQDYPNLEHLLVKHEITQEEQRVLDNYEYLVSGIVHSDGMSLEELLLAGKTAANGARTVCLDPGSVFNNPNHIGEWMRENGDERGDL